MAITSQEPPPSAVTAHPSEKPGAGVDYDYMSGKSLIPERYGDPATSGLAVTIESEGQEVRFELSP